MMGAGQVDQPEESEENFTMESLICKGSVVAVRPNVESLEDYTLCSW